MKVRAIIETGKNLDFDIYTDDDSLGFMLLAQGDTIEAAKADLQKSKEEMKAAYAESGEMFDFDSLEFEYVFDTVSFLKYSPFTLTGLSKATGINSKQLSHYVTGYRKPSAKTIQRIQTGVTKFAETFSHAVLV
ncbi:MAG: helix-turn-helix transcriptional regulator [Bacteroidales bacterium]|nr:helix-turn-helix transcriptional regulator [Bacteroidales bacterium]MBR0077278.1 helix-turn-helix transcriptional regulator [Bacteroidales bacterium]